MRSWETSVSLSVASKVCSSTVMVMGVPDEFASVSSCEAVVSGVGVDVSSAGDSSAGVELGGLAGAVGGWAALFAGQAARVGVRAMAVRPVRAVEGVGRVGELGSVGGARMQGGTGQPPRMAVGSRVGAAMGGGRGLNRPRASS